MLSQISTFLSRNNVADAIISLVFREDVLKEALTCDLLNLLFAEVGGLTHDVDLQEAHFEMKLRSSSFRIYRALDVRM